MKHIASCSFGKDSLAMVLMLLEKKIPLDEVVFYDTGMEFQAIYNLRNKLVPMLKQHGIKYVELRPQYSFEWKMFEKPVKGKQRRSCNDCLYCETLHSNRLKAFNPSQCQNPNSKFYLETDDWGNLPWNKGCSKHDNGNSKITHYGYSWCGGTCRWGTTDKVKTIDSYAEKESAYVYVGIALDETERIEKERKHYKLLPLVDLGMTEKDCLVYCRDRGWNWVEESPVTESGLIDLYDILDRVSCWCCANKNRKELKNIYWYLPQYWQQLKKLQSKTERPMKKFYNMKHGNYGNVFAMEKVFEQEVM